MTTPVSSLFSLRSQCALVTGGTRGIGKSIALALAESGADVILVQRDPHETATRDQIRSFGRTALIYQVDLSDKEAVSRLIPTVRRDGHCIDILVNAAGIQKRHPCHAFPTSDWDEVIQVNLSTAFTLCRDVGAHMLERPLNSSGRRGSIINVASLMSFQGGLRVPAYAASKGAVATLTRALANEWAGKAINVNAVAPGYVETDMNSELRRDENRMAEILRRIPAGRWGHPDDFRGPVVFLASAASNYVSGEILVVDGGWMGR